MSVLSSTAPNTVFETQSKFNGSIAVVDKGRTRKLIINGVLQSANFDSPIIPKMCWGKIANILSELSSLNRVLILGLGGGTVARLISEKYPNAEIISVDIDPVVVDVARNYFNLEAIKNHRIIVADACGVVTSPEEFGLSPNEFDAIIVDIFQGEVYPDIGNSGSFFAGIKKLLRPEGMAIFNRIYLNHHQDDVNNFIENVSEFYLNVKSVIVAGYTNSDHVVIYGFV